MAATKRKPPAKDVSSYIAVLPVGQKKALIRLRKIIRSAAPKATETISWGMPHYKQGGMLAFFAAFKDHLSLFMPDLALMKELKKDLKAFDVHGGTIHFSPEKPIPSTLVKKLIKARLVRIEKKQNYSKT